MSRNPQKQPEKQQIARKFGEQVRKLATDIHAEAKATQPLGWKPDEWETEKIAGKVKRILLAELNKLFFN